MTNLRTWRSTECLYIHFYSVITIFTDYKPHQVIRYINVVINRLCLTTWIFILYRHFFTVNWNPSPLSKIPLMTYSDPFTIPLTVLHSVLPLGTIYFLFGKHREQTLLNLWIKWISYKPENISPQRCLSFFFSFFFLLDVKRSILFHEALSPLESLVNQRIFILTLLGISQFWKTFNESTFYWKKQTSRRQRCLLFWDTLIVNRIYLLYSVRRILCRTFVFGPVPVSGV